MAAEAQSCDRSKEPWRNWKDCMGASGTIPQSMARTRARYSRTCWPVSPGSLISSFARSAASRVQVFGTLDWHALPKQQTIKPLLYKALGDLPLATLMAGDRILFGYFSFLVGYFSVFPHAKCEMPTKNETGESHPKTYSALILPY